ncbi:MAG: ester cyclase [Thermoanaerobaculia bacterium]|jgi:predicted ester cyclase
MEQRRGFLKLALTALASTLVAPFRALLGVEKAAIRARPAAGAPAISAAEERIVRTFYGQAWSAGSRDVFQSHPATAHQCQELFDRFRRAFPDLRIDVQSIQKSGDQIHVRWTAQGTHRGILDSLAPTGRHVQAAGLTKMKIVDGKIVSTIAEWDEAALKAQLAPRKPG